MEAKVSARAEMNGQMAYGQTGFRKHHSTMIQEGAQVYLFLEQIQSINR